MQSASKVLHKVNTMASKKTERKLRQATRRYETESNMLRWNGKLGAGRPLSRRQIKSSNATQRGEATVWARAERRALLMSKYKIDHDKAEWLLDNVIKPNEPIK